MSKVGAPKKLIINNKRLDGRKLDEMREIKIDVGNLKRAQGSAVFAFGNTKAQAAAYGPKIMHPRYLQDPTRTVLRCKYSLLPFSTKERARPGHSRRSTELSKVITEAFSSVVYLSGSPKTAIDVFIEILQADASTRCAGINAASLALADAGIEMRDLISSCAVGKVDGKLVLDVFGLEDNYGEVDCAMAVIGKTDKFVLLQMDGIVTKEEFFKILEIGRQGCYKIYDEQKRALKEKYGIMGEENVTEK